MDSPTLKKLGHGSGDIIGLNTSPSSIKAPYSAIGYSTDRVKPSLCAVHR